jgi:hypothetical protein
MDLYWQKIQLCNLVFVLFSCFAFVTLTVFLLHFLAKFLPKNATGFLLPDYMKKNCIFAPSKKSRLLSLQLERKIN